VGDDNIWTDTWDEGEDWSGGGARAKRLPRGDELGATVYELAPGNWLPFHFHHGSEEYLVVLRGRPTLRTSDSANGLADRPTALADPRCRAARFLTEALEVWLRSGSTSYATGRCFA
jgi:hypothetical protein